MISVFRIEYNHTGYAAIENALNDQKTMLKSLETVLTIAICRQGNTRHKKQKRSTKKYRIGTARKNSLLECLNRFHGANVNLSS